MRDILVNLFRFTGLVLLQVLVLDNVHLSPYINPYIYPLFILLLPINYSPWMVMLLSLFMGLAIDTFSNSMGIHGASLVLMGFARAGVLNILVPKTGYEMDMEPKLGQFGFNWFLTYALLLVSLHHLALFILEVFSLGSFFLTMQKAFVSNIFSVFLMILLEFIFYRRRQRV